MLDFMLNLIAKIKNILIRNENYFWGGDVDYYFTVRYDSHNAVMVGTKVEAV